jgi:hypothetical protein
MGKGEERVVLDWEMGEAGRVEVRGVVGWEVAESLL